MSFAAAAVGASVVTGIMGANAASDAASSQARSARDAQGLQQRQYDQTRADQAPWREAGGRALTQMEDPNFQKSFTMADYQADPGYAFRLAEGQKALERSAAARGGLQGGATMKSLAKYNSGMASDEYGKAYDRFNNDQSTRFNRLASVAGVGQTAVNQTAAAGQNYANQAGDAMMQVGNAQAAGAIGQANAIGGALNSGANTWMTMSQMNKKPVVTPSNPSNPTVTTGYLGSYDWSK